MQNQVWRRWDRAGELFSSFYLSPEIC